MTVKLRLPDLGDAARRIVAGYRNVYYLTLKLRVPLRATQAEAKCANAKK